MKAPSTPLPQPNTTAPSTSFESASTLSEYFFGQDNCWDKTYDEIQVEKNEWHLPISIGANNWFHIDRDERVYGNGYGVPSESGTYYYFVGADPSFNIGDTFLKEVGAHVQFRFRDDAHDKLRAFYYDTYWFYEAYAYAKTKYGTFKAGEIVKQFGLAWDGTWWEGVPYFDGYKFNPDYGISWQNNWKISSRFSLTSVTQFFVASNRVSGAIPDADAESTLGLKERNTGIVRIVPTWEFSNDMKLEWGVSALAGGIDGPDTLPHDSSHGAFGSDISFTWRKLGLFAEYIDGLGVTTPTRFVSGGPSDRVDSLRGGISYQYGPVRFHVNYSRGWDHNPGGHQFVFDPGLSTQVTKNLVIYAEYVKWDVTNRFGQTSTFDDGFELIAAWNL